MSCSLPQQPRPSNVPDPPSPKSVSRKLSLTSMEEAFDVSFDNSDPKPHIEADITLGLSDQSVHSSSAPWKNLNFFAQSNASPIRGVVDGPNASEGTLDLSLQNVILQIWLSAQERIASLRNLILIARVEVRRERIRCTQQEDFFEKIMNSLMVTLNTATTQGSYLNLRGDLDFLASRSRTANHDLKLLKEKRDIAEGSLSNLEYQLSELETEIYSHVDARFQVAHYKHTSNASRATSEHENAPMHAPKGPTPAALDELYSRMSDLRILLDRLNEFEFGLREELDQRDILRATGNFNVSDDNQFFEESRAERHDIQYEVEHAQADIERLKQQCLGQGIEFEGIHLPTRLSNNSLGNNLTGETDRTLVSPQGMPNDSFDTLSTEDTSRTLVVPQRFRSSSIIDNFFDARERVRDWLKLPSSSETPQSWPASSLSRETRSDVGWVLTPSTPQPRRPSSTNGTNAQTATNYIPEWTSGPPPGSKDLEQLLRESTLNSPETNCSSP